MAELYRFERNDMGLSIVPVGDICLLSEPEESLQSWIEKQDDLEEWRSEPDPTEGIPFYGACSYWKNRQGSYVFPPWFWRQLAELNALGSLWDSVRPPDEAAPTNRGWLFRLYWTRDNEVVAVRRGQGAHFDPDSLVGFVTREPYETNGVVRHRRVLTLLEESY